VLAAIRMKFKLLTILIFGSLTGYAQSASYGETAFQENQADSINFKLDSILIAGVGTAATKIFLDNFSNNLIRNFNERGVNARYYFLGRDVIEAKKRFDSLNKSGYKAVLLFLPTNYAIFGSTSSSISNLNLTRLLEMFVFKVRPDPNPPKNSRLNYHQTFELKLLRTDRNMERFWSASVEFDGSPRGGRKAVKIAETLFYVLGKNNYFQ
jgi:hypothetical protein